MGEEIIMETIESRGDEYLIVFRYADSGKEEFMFVQKHVLFALLCVAEKDACEAEMHECKEVE
jgi:hypothetical protein